MSLARTPTRAGLHVMVGDQQLAYKSGCDLLHRWQATCLLTQFLFATPMVGASPDNIGAQRLTEGGVPASETGSAIEMTYRAERAQSNREPASASKHQA